MYSRLFEQIYYKHRLIPLYEYILREMASPEPRSFANVIMSQIFQNYKKFGNNVHLLVKNAINYFAKFGRPLKFQRNKQIVSNREEANLYANDVIAHCEGIANNNATKDIKDADVKGFNPYQIWISIPEFSSTIKPEIKKQILDLYDNNYNELQ